MTTYITRIGELIGERCARLPRAVLYGENIDNGSRIVGMCRNLKAPEGGRILNVGDCEATQIGAGFGMMLNGVTAVLFAKQLDFMLLGIDQFVNTYNFIRCARAPATLGSFTVMVIVCDQGLQGPQSSFNALGDLCSMARVPGFTLTNAQDAPRVLQSELGKPGFRFIALSQRLFAGELLDPGFVEAAPDLSVLQYGDGEDATIVCWNFALPQGYVLQTKLREQGRSASLFSVNYLFPLDAERIIASVGRTGFLVVIDDGKSTTLAAHRLLHDAATRHPNSRRLLVERGMNLDFEVSPDVLPIDYDAILSQFLKPSAAIESGLRLH